jgi:hypothetical protein
MERMLKRSRHYLCTYSLYFQINLPLGLALR